MRKFYPSKLMNTVFLNFKTKFFPGKKRKSFFQRPGFFASQKSNSKFSFLKRIHFVLAASFCSLSFNSNAQVPTCTGDVPYYYVDLTGQPAGTWTSPPHSRAGSCCGSNSGCTSFDVVLDPKAAMVNFDISSGAVPTGALYYQIDCGQQIPVGQAICIVGSGIHHVTFCKPGNNQNTYVITSIAKPIFPPDTVIDFGCSKQLTTLGMIPSSITWNSVYPGTFGQYNSYLSCASGCANPLYTPSANAPPYIDFQVCGSPIASSCGFISACDTMRVFNLSALSATAGPNPANFCAGGGGVLLTASASGGNGVYTFIWRDQNGNVVGNNSTYQATAAGTYAVEVRDGLYNSSLCLGKSISLPVTVGQIPVVNAGADQTLCTSSPTAYISGVVQNAR